MLITYLHPSNQEIMQIMLEEPESGESSGEERRGGSGRGHCPGMRKQEVETENHCQIKLHLIEINEDEEGGEKTGGSLGENVIIALYSIAAIIFLCICLCCSFMAYRCGLCPKRRGRRRHSFLSSISSGRKRPEHEDFELI